MKEIIRITYVTVVLHSQSGLLNFGASLDGGNSGEEMLVCGAVMEVSCSQPLTLKGRAEAEALPNLKN